MRAIYCLPALLLLGACATRPGIAVRTVTAPVVRVETCVAIADIPAPPAALPRRPASAVVALDLAVAKLLEWTSYGEKADAVMRGCATAPGR